MDEQIDVISLLIDVFDLTVGMKMSLRTQSSSEGSRDADLMVLLPPADEARDIVTTKTLKTIFTRVRQHFEVDKHL